MIRENDTLADIISINPSLGFVLYRFGIELDSEERILSDACLALGIDAQFFVDILNLYHDPTTFDPDKMKAYPVSVIIDYLKKTHKFYLTKRLIEIEQSVKNLIKTLEDQPDILSYLSVFFLKYRKNLVEHIREEEGVLFPYIKLINQNPHEALVYHQKDQKTPLEEFMGSHDDAIEQDLSELRVFLMKKLPNLRQNTLSRVFLTQLETFEKDLNIHALVEDDILLPLALSIEKSIFDKVA